jgi:hypothetical protein
MPADYGSIVRSSLADVKFLPHESKGSVAAGTLASKDGSILPVISIRTARKVLVHNYG